MKIILILILLFLSKCQGFALDEEIDRKYVRIPYGGFPGVDGNLTEGVKVDYLKKISIFASHMKVRNIQRAVVFSCGSLFENGKIIRTLSKSGATAKVVDLQGSVDEAGLRVLLPLRCNLAVYLDMDCGGRATRIVEMSANIFDEGFSWVLVGSNIAEIVRVMATAYLNVNSDVILTMPIGINSESWISFDLYNHGFNYAGIFNMTFHGVHAISNTNMGDVNVTTERGFPESLILNQNDNITKEVLSMKVKRLVEDSKYYCQVFANTIGDGAVDTVVFGNKKVQYIKGWWIFLIDNWIQRRWRVDNITFINGHVSVAKFKGKTFEQFASIPVDTHIEVFQRYNYVLYTHLMQMIGFRLEHLRVTSWGVLKNNSWSGLVGAIHRGQADVSTSPVQPRTDRLGFGENTVITYTVKIAMVFKQPKSVEVSLQTFVRPLAPPVWWTALVFCALSAALYVLAVRSENNLFGANENSVEGSWSYAVMAVVSVLYQQGPERSPRLWSGRTVTAALLVLGAMLYQFYSASLVGSLLTAPPRTVRGPRDLLEGPFGVGAEEQPYQRSFFVERKYPYVGELYDRKIAPRGRKPAFMAAEEGMQKVLRGGYAFQVYSDTAYKIMQGWDDESICQYDEFYVFPKVVVSPWVRRFFPFKQHILTGLRRMQERGVSARELQTWSTARPRCPPEYSSQLQAVGVQLAPALAALAAAGVLAVFILMAEILVHRISLKRQPRRIT